MAEQQTIDAAIAELEPLRGSVMYNTMVNAVRRPGEWFVAFVGHIRDSQRRAKEIERAEAGFEVQVAPHNTMSSWRVVSIKKNISRGRRPPGQRQPPET